MKKSLEHSGLIADKPIPKKSVVNEKGSQDMDYKDNPIVQEHYFVHWTINQRQEFKNFATSR